MAAQKPVKKIRTAANYDSITVTAPSSINLGVMTVGRATTGQSNSDGSITNAAAPWTVHVSDTATGDPVIWSPRFGLINRTIENRSKS